jgi:hypothetical protein
MTVLIYTFEALTYYLSNWKSLKLDRQVRDENNNNNNNNNNQSKPQLNITLAVKEILSSAFLRLFNSRVDA